MRPMFKYMGGKWRVAKHYPRPRYGTVVEPFAGSAGYSSYWVDSIDKAILNDLDPKLASIWRWLIRAEREEILELPLLAVGEAIPDWVTGARREFLARRSMSSAKPWYKWTALGYFTQAVKARVADDLAKIRTWESHNLDYKELPDIEATWFIDPPYVGRLGGMYEFGNKWFDYSALADWCMSRRGQVIVCENEGADWLPFRQLATVRGCVRSGKEMASREVIWTND
jgi:site-specific DNA-adenine methylase